MSPSSVRLFTALVVVSLLFSVLPAFSTPPAADAQDGPTPTPTAETQESGTDPGAGEAQAEETATAEVQNSGVATYIAETRTCPPGFDPSAGDASAALAGCVEVLPGIAVTLGTQNPNYPGDTRTAGGDGLAAWPDIPLGTAYSVTQSIPQGYADPWVYCEVTGGPGADQFTFFPATGGVMDVGFSDPNLANYSQAYCRWFNIPAGDSARVLTKLAPVDIFSYLCPPGTAIEGSTRDALWQTCNTPAEGIQFALSQAQENPVSEETDDDGHLTLGVKPGGQFTLTQTAPEGHQLGPVYCVPTPPPDFPDALVWELFPVENGSISYNLLEDYSLKCEFYNLPDAGTESEDKEGTPSASPVAGDSGSVIVHKYLCPPDLYEPAADLQTYLDGCPTPHYGVTVEVRQGIEVLSSETVSYGGDGSVSFPAIPAGSVDLASPSDSDLSRIFCRSYPRGESDPQVANYEATVPVLDVEAGIETDCYWFTFPEEPDDTYSTITVAAHRCGSDFPEFTTGQTQDDRIAACPDPFPGVAFQAYRSEVLVDVGATGEDGLAILHAQPGELSIIEMIPEGFGAGYVWCEIRDEGVAPEYVNAGTLSAGEPGAPLGNAAEPHAYYCDFFNAPSESGNIVVTKWRCPEHYDVTGASLEKLLGDCATPHDGVTIGVYYPSGESFTEQTVSGKGGPAIARFEGLPPGKAGLGEPAPNGHALKRAFCSTGEVSQPALTGMTGYVEHNVGENGIPITIEAEKEISCHLFNVPVVEEDSAPKSGMVIVNKRICPPGFAAIPKSYVDIAMYCTSEGGVEFQVTQGETALSAVTGGDGVAEFTGLSAGALRITELPKEGYDPPKVFCRETKEGEGETGELLPVTVDSWGVTYDLREGYYLQCVWANLPSAGTSTDPGTVILHAYTCPEGTGEYESLETLQASCTDRPEGLKFTAGPALKTPAEASTSSGGDVTFANLAPGFNVVEVPDKQGYAALTSWCDYYISATGSADEYGRHTTRPQYAFLAGGYTLECYWFSVPYVEPVTVIAVMRVCPADFDLVDATTDNIAANCPNGPEGVPFRVNNASGFQSTPSDDIYDATQLTDVSGALIFSDVSITKFVMAEQSPRYETVRVICGHTVTFDPPSSYLTLGITNDEVSYQAEPGAIVSCTWATQEVPPFDVGIHMSVCPPYYEFASADVEYLTINCQVKEGVDFRIVNEEGVYDKTVTTSVAGLAVFDQVLPGVLVMTEGSPDLRVVRAFCRTPDSSYSSLEFTSDSAEYLAATGENVVCYWFTIDTTQSRYSLFKYACPDGYVPEGQTYDEVLQACPTPVKDVRFDFTDSQASWDDTSDEDGILIGQGVSPGPLTITETPPPGYTGAVVFCREITPGQPEPDFAEVPVENFTVEREVGGGNELECHWFNYEVPYTKVTIHKYGCREGFIPGDRTDEALLQECPTPLESVEFLLGGPAAEISRATDASGVVVWDEVQPGPIFITETPPAGYTGATVICRVDREASAQVPVNNFTIELQVESGKSIVCFWLNYREHTDTPAPGTPTPVPPSGGGGGNGGSGDSGTGGQGGGQTGGQFGGSTSDPDAPASLIITRYTCEPGYDVHDPEADSAEDCEELTDDIAFALAPEGADEAETRVTGSDGKGRVEFVGLEAGAYLLAETLPEETWLAFISTCQSDQRQFQAESPFLPFAYAAPDGRIGVVLVAGETLECDWYNVPDKPGTLTLTDYSCPGDVVILSTCEPSTDGRVYTLMPLDDGEDVTLEIGEDGTAMVEVEGAYEIVEEGFEWCFMESDVVDAEGNVTIGPGEQASVTIYNCGPQPES
jgi:hypothetical protein